MRDQSVQTHESASLDGELGLGAGATRMCRIGVAAELHHLGVLQAQSLLEALANLEEDLLALLEGAALATGVVPVTTARDWLADSASPETDTVEALPDVDDNTHDFTVTFVLERLTNGGQHDVQPQSVDVDGLLLLELESPLATVLVLRVFPLRADTLLEEVVVGLEGEFGGRGDIVLERLR